MKRKILSIVLTFCMVLMLVPTMAFAEEITPETLQADTDGVYQIGTSAELYGFAQLVNNGETDQDTKAVLTADITVNRNLLNSLNDDGTVKDGADVTSWTPIGTSLKLYTGKFDGQGHTIRGLYIYGTIADVDATGKGLFGWLGENGEIKNVGVIDSYIQGHQHIGGVCGVNYGGKITDCYNSGTIRGGNDTGGVCGSNMSSMSSGTVTGCYNTGTVSGEYRIGGVCGYNGVNGISTIIGCYNTGTVSGDSGIGGVCGINDYGSTITGCYNTGTVSGGISGGVCGSNRNHATITDCYINKNVVCGDNRSTVVDCNVMSDEEFADGTVCKLLNTALQTAGSDVRFCQRIGRDASPLLTYQFGSMDEHTDDNPKDHTCDICGETISDHSYTREDTTIEGALKTAGNCTTESVYYYSCEVCGEVEKDDNHTFTVTGHTLTRIDAKTPTCTESGNIAYWTCSKCNKLFSDESGTNETTLEAVTVSTTSHTSGQWEYNSTQHWRFCTVCQGELDRADHTFSGNTCTVCGYTRPSSSSSSGGGFSGVYNYPVRVDSTSINGATVTLDKTSAVAGDKVTITVTPDAGKAVDEVIVTDADGKVIDVTKAGDNKYTFTMPAGKVNIAVTTKAADYQNKIVLQIGNRNILENNKTITNDVAPVIVDNRTMVPIRVITETLGGTAHWDADTQTVTLNIDGKTLTMTIGQTISGFDAAPIILNDRTYVPVRYVAERLGAMVEWDGMTQQIIITK